MFSHKWAHGLIVKIVCAFIVRDTLLKLQVLAQILEGALFFWYLFGEAEVIYDH